jgi:signal transduction histidine kinase
MGSVSTPSADADPARSRRWSLRNRLMLLAAVGTLIAWIMGAGVVYFVAAKESHDLFDERLRRMGAVILSFAEHEIDEIRSEGRDIVHVETELTIGSRYKYQIFSNTGDLLLLSYDAPRAPMAPLDQSDLADRKVGGVDMRTEVVWNVDRSKAVIVAEPLDRRDTVVSALHGYLVPMFLVSLGLLLVLNWWLFRRATQALQESATQLVDRSPNDLRPIQVGQPPTELEPLIASMNGLFERFQTALAAERRLTSSAAHELRTPLAAVKVQAQVAMRARTRNESQIALAHLTTCIDRASRMVDQLLALARIDSLAASPQLQVPLCLATLTELVLQDFGPDLNQRSLQVHKSLEPAPIRGMEFGVAILLRNLIDNAMRYGPAQGDVRVTTGRDGDRSFVHVEDAGHGVSVDERERIFELFYRGTKSRGVDGCGIGLSIVQTVARLHRADIRLGTSPLGGLSIKIEFPTLVEVGVTHPTGAVGNLPSGLPLT